MSDSKFDIQISMLNHARLILQTIVDVVWQIECVERTHAEEYHAELITRWLTYYRCPKVDGLEVG